MPFLVDDPSRGISTPIGPGGLGHNFETAPDGNEYFTVLGPSINLIVSIQNMYEAARIFSSYPKGRDQAAAIEVIIKELETAVHASGISTAQFAQDRARSLLEQRIVRPQTPHASHLKDAIIARAIGGVTSWGAVGIGDISRLDEFPYWKAIEFGSTHLVGKQLRGFFYDAGGNPSAPSGGDFRAHPIFKVGKGPKMVVRNPIEGKHFLTEATFDALGYRYRIWRNVEQASVAQVRAVRVASVGDLAGKPYTATVGGFAKLARYRGTGLL